MKIISEQPTDIFVGEMKDGQIAIITHWIEENYIGRIVQRHEKKLISLGMHADSSWPQAFEESVCGIANQKCRVRILAPGTQLEI